MKKEIINKLDIYKIKTTEELLKYYQNWTDKNKYNKDMVDWKYTAPQETVSVLKKYALNKNSKILDAGCGTGLVGIELKKYGYSNIEGVDFSQSMLDLVPQNIYKKIEKIEQELTAYQEMIDDQSQVLDVYDDNNQNVREFREKLEKEVREILNNIQDGSFEKEVTNTLIKIQKKIQAQDNKFLEFMK